MVGDARVFIIRNRERIHSETNGILFRKIGGEDC